MKNVLFLLIASLCFSLNVMAQSAKDIKLNAPNKKTGSPFMQALADRASVREFSTKELSVQQLSDLLWAANGVSRADGRRTAPSAMNRQDVDVYVIMKSGAYLYDANNNILKLVTEGDFREYVAGRQTSVKDAPVSLVLVSDLSRFGKSDDKTKLFAAVDVGTVCQNINVFCAATGLATVPRASMDEDKLKEVLKLTDNQLLLMNNPVGYKKD